MILVDSSVWIDWLNAEDTAQTDALARLLDEPESPVICDRVLQEVLQGIRDDRHADNIERTLTALTCLDTGGVKLALASAALYRGLRKQGITIRAGNDIVIAALCMQYKLQLLHCDRDFDAIAKVTRLDVWTGK